MQKVCIEALRIANVRKTYCPDFGISDGFRTILKQSKLFEIGRKWNTTHGEWDTIGKTVTNCDGVINKSNHQSGLAIDFIVWIDGKISEDPAMYALVATCFYEAAANLKLEGEWGGCYKSLSDLGHFDIKEIL